MPLAEAMCLNCPQPLASRHKEVCAINRSYHRCSHLYYVPLSTTHLQSGVNGGFYCATLPDHPAGHDHGRRPSPRQSRRDRFCWKPEGISSWTSLNRSWFTTFCTQFASSATPAEASRNSALRESKPIVNASRRMWRTAWCS